MASGLYDVPHQQAGYMAAPTSRVLQTKPLPNVDLIWFGVLTVIAIEVGLLTPPLDLSVFVVKASKRHSAIRR